MRYGTTVRVQTEPSGARVYCQDQYVGDSPTKITLTTQPFNMTQAGWYQQQYVYDSFDGRTYGHQKVGATNWTGPLQTQMSAQSWTFQAFMEGYEPATKTLTLTTDDALFQDEVRNHWKVDSNGRLQPTDWDPGRDILLVLKPVKGQAATQQQQQQQQQQQSTVVVPGQQTSEKDTLGTVIVSSNVDDAEVSVDGVFVGNAPATLKLKEGIHIIEVTKHGHQSFKRELRVLPNSEVPLRATLEK